ncbi:MAG: lysozyme family protein [Lachnospiraceae bacterium]|nr:lysozyme family protein [Lachnospiraceae bacterium]
MPQIKTRDVLKGTVKAIDKSVVAAQRMKDSYVRIKDKAEHGYYSSENTPEEYATDRFSATSESVLHEAGHQLDKRSRKAVKETKDNFSKAKDYFKQKKAEEPIRKAREQAKQAARYAGKTPKQAADRINPKENITIRTRGHSTLSVRQSARSAGNTTVNTLRRGAKETGRSIKTAEMASKTAVKTGQQAAKSAQAAAKATQKTVQTAKVAAQKAAQAAKRTAQATARAVRAIIAGVKTLISAIVAGGWVAVVIILIIVLLGCAVSIFGGGSRSSTYTPVSAEVEAYDPMIRKYAQQYGIPEYVELIKAVMMQESGGRGLDPMQAAEGGFNIRYPHVPNGITDPEYSVECGVQELKAALEAAGVENPVDMERIKLALQGYNYGSGYISWALRNYGGYSVANAAEFSDMQAAKLGWSSYGDKQYVAHVLQYYPYGRAFSMGFGNQAIVELALSQVGQEGGHPYWSWYGFGGRVEWCACFVSWCANECGYIEAGIIPKFSLCSDGVDWFQAQGQWQPNTYEPVAGDIIFFDWGANGTIDHVGIVEYCENGVVHTVEGNSGDACRQRTYSVGSSNIYGYGLPAY